jgi:hypothetical protein
MLHKPHCAACPTRLACPCALNRDFRAGKRSLTVFCGNCAFSHNISADSTSSGDLDSQELPP